MRRGTLNPANWEDQVTMNLSATTESAISHYETMPPAISQLFSQMTDKTLDEARSGRRLTKIVNSIQSYLNNEISKLETAIEKCQQAADNDRVLQHLRMELENERQSWEADRDAEAKRLHDASEKLIQAWQQLEEERRRWMDEREQIMASQSR